MVDLSPENGNKIREKGRRGKRSVQLKKEKNERWTTLRVVVAVVVVVGGRQKTTETSERLSEKWKYWSAGK